MDVLESRRLSSLAAVALGIVIAVAVTSALSMSAKWTAFGMIGFAATLPALLFRPARTYGLVAFLFLLVIEPNGKNIGGYFLDGVDYPEIYGIPPSIDHTIVIWPSDVVLLILTGFWLVRLVYGGRDAVMPGAGYLLLAFIAWAAFVSLARSEVLYFSLGELIRYCKFLLVYIYFANNIDSVRLAKIVVYVLLACLLLESAVVLAAFFLQTTGHPMNWLFNSVVSSNFAQTFENSSVISTTGSLGNRAVGTFGNFLYVAMFFELLIPLAFALFWIDRRFLRKVLYAGLFAAGVAGHVVTFSRMGLISLTIGLGVCVLFLYVRKFVSRKAMLFMIYAGCMGVLALTPYAYDYFTTRPENISRRIPLMEKAVAMILDKPVMGVGLNNHTAAKMKMFIPSEKTEDTQPVHNHYLALASEVGLVGFALQMVVFILFLKECWRPPNVDDPLVQGFLIAIFAGTCAFYVHLIGDPFSGHVPRSIFFFFAGMAVALQRLSPRKKQPQEANVLEHSRVPPSAVSLESPQPSGRLS